MVAEPLLVMQALQAVIIWLVTWRNMEMRQKAVTPSCGFAFFWTLATKARNVKPVTSGTYYITNIQVYQKPQGQMISCGCCNMISGSMSCFYSILLYPGMNLLSCLSSRILDMEILHAFYSVAHVFFSPALCKTALRKQNFNGFE